MMDATVCTLYSLKCSIGIICFKNPVHSDRDKPELPHVVVRFNQIAQLYLDCVNHEVQTSNCSNWPLSKEPANK